MATRLEAVPTKAKSVSVFDLPLARLIDDLGETKRLHALWTPVANPHGARLALLNAELERRYQAYPAADQDLQNGGAYQLLVTPRSLTHPVTLAIKKKVFAVLKKLKRDPLEVFEVTLTAMGAALGKDYVAANVPEERTGPRKFVVTPLAPAEQKKAA